MSVRSVAIILVSVIALISAIAICAEDSDAGTSTDYISQGTFENYDLSSGAITGDEDWQLAWSFGTGANKSSSMAWIDCMHAPTVVGEYVYAKMDNYLVKIDIVTGKEVKRVKTTDSFNGFYEVVVAAGAEKILLDSYSGKVFDLDLNQVFLIKQTGRSAYYYNGFFYIQCGTTDTCDAKTYCFSATDADTSVSNNIQEPVWETVTGGFHGQYYGGSTILFKDGFFIVAGVDESGNVILRTLSCADGSPISTVTFEDMNGLLTGKGYINFDGTMATVMAYNDKIEVGNANVGVVEVDSEGKMSNARTALVGEKTSKVSSLITVNGYGYVLNGGSLYAIDMGTLGIVASSTNYVKAIGAVHGNISVSVRDDCAYIYVIPYNSSDDIYVFRHVFADPSKITCTIMEDAIGCEQFSYQAAHFAADGSIVVLNDSGILFCIQRATSLAESVIVSETSVVMNVKDTVTLQAAVSPGEATKYVRWVSSDTQIATVDYKGVVTAVKTGSCTIYAYPRDSSKDVYAEVSVTSKSVPVSQIELSSTEVTIVKNSYVVLVAQSLPINATLRTVSWSSSDSSIASVLSTGRVNGIAIGTCTITATAKDGSGVTATCTVTVVESVDKKVEDITLSSESVLLNVGESVTITSTVSPSDAAVKTLNWTASSNVVSVSNGDIIALKAGTCTVTAKSTDGSNVSATLTVTVTQPAVPVSSVTLSVSEISICRGYSEVVLATVSPDNASVKDVIWSTSNSSVVTVEDGRITGISVGTCTVTATAKDGSGKYGSCTVTITEPILVTSIILSSNDISIKMGDSQTITATVSPSNASNKRLSWSSSDESVATVSNGVVYAMGEGTCTVYAAAKDGSGVSASCAVTVTVIHATGVKISETEYTGTRGTTHDLSATVSPSDAFDKTVSWTSSDEKIATVSSDGLVSLIAEGEATIMVTTNDGGFADSCKVTVVVVHATGVKMSESKYSGTEGSTHSLMATVSPSDAYDKVVSWKSSDEKIATVDMNGTVTLKSVGEATITVTTNDGGFTDTCIVTVTAKPAPSGVDMTIIISIVAVLVIAAGIGAAMFIRRH